MPRTLARCQTSSDLVLDDDWHPPEPKRSPQWIWSACSESSDLCSVPPTTVSAMAIESTHCHSRRSFHADGSSLICLGQRAHLSEPGYNNGLELLLYCLGWGCLSRSNRPDCL